MTCQQCGAPFVGKQASNAKKQKYCSQRCMGLSYRMTPEKFWPRVDKTSSSKGCWLWTGYCQKFGHGWLGTNAGLAHRYSWKLLRGPLEKGQCLLHTCDEPKCVNPEHLYLGDRSKNNRDMWARGRAATKLTPEAVREIRDHFAGDTGKKLPKGAYAELSAKFGVGQKTIWEIRRGKKWRHVQ